LKVLAEKCQFRKYSAGGCPWPNSPILPVALEGNPVGLRKIDSILKIRD